MTVSTIDLNLLVVFEAIFETQSVTKAAERLDMRQPAVSAALARLRNAFDDPLFVRAAGGMQATPRAIRLAPRVTLALTELRGAMVDVPFTPSAAKRTFRIASTDYTTLVLLPGVLETVRSEASGIDLRIIGYDKGDVPTLIDTGEVDVALGTFPKPPLQAVLQNLSRERFVGLARHDHVGLQTGTMSLDSFVAADHALVSLRRDATGEIDRILALRGLARRVALVLPHMLCLPDILTRTDLIAAIPCRVADRVVNARLKVFELPIVVPAWHVQMLWNPATRGDTALSWLRSRITQVARTF